MKSSWKWQIQLTGCKFAKTAHQAVSPSSLATSTQGQGLDSGTTESLKPFTVFSKTRFLSISTSSEVEIT